jgi:hypothetical protein
MSPSATDGRHIPAWSGRRKVVATARVNAEGRSATPPKPCVICEQSIDYDLPTSHPDSCSVQHLKARSTHPHLTWLPSNWAPAHLNCNKSAGASGRTSEGTMGVPTQAW